MSAITQCPQCKTYFKVSPAQLEAHQGMVRCGRCQAAFDAAEYMQQGIATEPDTDIPLVPPVQTVTQDASEPAANGIPIKAAAPIARAQKISFATDHAMRPRRARRKRRNVLWGIGCLLLITVLLAQAAYLFRVELAARLPGLKPALVSYCHLLHCAVPLPHQADLMSIVSSELEVANPAQPNVITLNAILRNHAPYPQAYPNLELALTDVEDRVVARRVFAPSEYLGPENSETQGIAPEREANLKLRLDTTDLKASGYRLLLFYPQQQRSGAVTG